MNPSKIVISCIEQTPVRRRWIPITVTVNRPGELVQFEKKLPFNAAKLVGIRTVISLKQNNVVPIDTGGEGSEEIALG